MVVAGRAVPRQESDPLKSKATGSGTAEPAASSEADRRFMSLGDVSGPVNGMPAGATPDATEDPTTGVPAGERQNKAPIYVSGVTDTRGFLAWLREACQSGTLNCFGLKCKVTFVTAPFRPNVHWLWSLWWSATRNI
jgi:hypothetical protein